MTVPIRGERDEPAAGSLTGFLLLVLLILFTGPARRRASRGIRLAPPATIPLAADAADHVANDLGMALSALIDAERRRAGA